MTGALAAFGAAPLGKSCSTATVDAGRLSFSTLLTPSGMVADLLLPVFVVAAAADLTLSILPVFGFPAAAPLLLSEAELLLFLSGTAPLLPGARAIVRAGK